MKYIKKFNESISVDSLRCIYHLSEEVKGYTYWQTRDVVVPKIHEDLYFLGYEEYEGIYVDITTNGSTVEVVIPGEYYSSYIRTHEKKLKKFFKRLGKQILYEDIADNLELTTVAGESFEGDILNMVIT